PRDSSEADVEQYTFGGERATLIIETDRDGDGIPEADSRRCELYSGKNVVPVSSLPAHRWRLRLLLGSNNKVRGPKISSVGITVKKTSTPR
ncbi:MAG: hypothetical protein U9R15_09315, partial [Chloroflexota bacterium]|nr:hypothetical protein [Chloroflexota bacterium]